MLRVVLLCLSFSLQFIMLFARFSLHLANGSAHGTKRVRVKMGQLKRVCFGSGQNGLGQNGFGLEQVRVGTDSGYNGFWVGAGFRSGWLEMFFKEIVHQGAILFGSKRYWSKRYGSKWFASKRYEWTNKTYDLVCDYEDFGYRSIA
ncbi:hypothetical protein Hdeb2414_s0009g00320381 [Helianthus debilis subsp. tardiflorus]